MREAQEIRKSVQQLSRIKEKAVLRSYGIGLSESERSNDENDSEESCSDLEPPPTCPPEGNSVSVCQDIRVTDPSQQEILEDVMSADMEESDEDICSESDTKHDPAIRKQITDPLQPEAKIILEKKIKFLCLKAKRKASKEIAQARLLKRKRSKRIGRIMKQYPDIEKTIEDYVRSNDVGADAWRRRGVV